MHMSSLVHGMGFIVGCARVPHTWEDGVISCSQLQVRKPMGRVGPRKSVLVNLLLPAGTEEVLLVLTKGMPGQVDEGAGGDLPRREFGQRFLHPIQYLPQYRRTAQGAGPRPLLSHSSVWTDRIMSDANQSKCGLKKAVLLVIPVGTSRDKAGSSDWS